MDALTPFEDGSEDVVSQNNSLDKEKTDDSVGAPKDGGSAVTNGSGEHTMLEVSENAVQQNIIDSTDNCGISENEQRALEHRQLIGNRFHNKTFSGPPPMRGRGFGNPNNPFTRGGVGRGGPNGASGGGGFDPNWQNQNRDSTNGGFTVGQGPPPMNGPPLELWVEAKTDDGKSYFYHAITRETTWNKPEGQNVKVMTQTEIEEMNKKQQNANMPENVGNAAGGSGSTTGVSENNDEKNVAAVNNSESTQPMHQQPQLQPQTQQQQPPQLPIQQIPPQTQQQTNVLTQQPPPTSQPQLQHPPPALAPPVVTQQPPPGMHQQPPPFFPPGMHPPNFSQPPFGMPPPGYGGGFPAPGAPWGMAWNQQHMHAPPTQQQEKPAKNLIIKPGVIDPAVIARAAEWSEHRAPDGRPYYYHAGRSESVWEKPQAIRDMEAARMAAHSGATPQQAAASMPQPVPHMMPNPLMHMPPVSAPAHFDPSIAYNAAAAAAAAAAASAAAAVAKVAETTKAAQTATIEKESKKAAEEKRKKDEEQKKATTVTKPVDKSRPISSTPIAGTPWCVVWTGDGRVFFYNPSTRTSVWERPEDLLEREDVDKAVTNPPEQLKNVVQPTPEKTAAEKVEKVIAPVVEAEEPDDDDDDDEIIKIRTESESSVEEVPTKRIKISKQSKRADANEAVVEAEVRAAKERALVPLETRVKQFKDMLREKDVSAFSTWEKELHKIVFDPRYLLLTSKERKQVFEKYVKDRAEEERKEKRNKMRQKRDDFRKLMEDVKLHGKSSFSDFCQRYGKDDRYKAIEKVRERESLFNEFIVDMRRKEKEEKIQKKEQIRKDFIEMLRERSDVDRHTRWHDIKKKFESDSRYRAVENSMYREEYFMDFLRIVKDEKRKLKEQKDREREKEREREREQRERERRSERKSDRKDKERGRDRSKDRERVSTKDQKDKEKDKDRDKAKEKDNKDKDKDREKEKERDKEAKQKEVEKKNAVDDELNDGELHSTSDDDESERLQKERDRQLRAEQSIREREKEVLRTLAGHLRDRDKEREHHKRDEATRHFNALLTDLVRNPDLTWKEVKRQLRKDHRWELVEQLDREEREKIFNEHIDLLMKKKREKFREMLDDVSTLELTSSWKDIKKLVKEDPRYLKYNNSDKCEREFRDYIKDRTVNAKSSLRELLQECKLITHKSSEMVRENPNHLKEIEDILKNDKRYLILNHIAEERTTIIVNYLEDLHKRGPPPPPTASESVRRNK